MTRNFLIVFFLAVSFFVSAPGYAADVGELERRIDMLSDELDRVKGSGGSGDGIADHTSVHGYGEMHMEWSDENRATIDNHRFVLGVHSELADWIHLNAEMDFEHAMQTLEFEFAYLDFLVSDKLNFRTGVMLMPVGNLNEFHEPPRFYSVERPNFHDKLIPTTWQQGGFGIFGQADEGINYRLYVVNAVQSVGPGGTGAAGYFRDEDFIRKGRQQLKYVVANDWAATGRLEYKKISGTDLGFSFYTGCSSQGYVSECGLTSIVEGDVKYRWRAGDLDFSSMKGWVEGTAELNLHKGTNSSDIPKSAFGFMAQAALHLPQQLGWKTTHDFVPYFKYEKIRPNDVVGDNATSSDRTKNFESVAIGFSYMPVKKVALKMDWHLYRYGPKVIYDGQNAADPTVDCCSHHLNNKESVVRVGVAYMY